VWDGLGIVDGAGEEDDFDFESLLIARDAGLSRNKDTTTMTSSQMETTPVVAATTASSELRDSNNGNLCPCLPCWKIYEIEENFTCKKSMSKVGGVGGTDIGADEDDVEDEDDDYVGGMDEEYVNSLIQSYIKDEDEADIIQSLSAVNINKLNSTSADAGAVVSKTKTTTGGTVGGKNNHTSQHNENDGDAETVGFENKLSRSSVKDKTERRFQNRLARHPKQVLRYAYGGSPLWVSHPFPNVQVQAQLLGTQKQTAKSARSSSISATARASSNWCSVTHESIVSVPVCELCRSERVFECQLMPTLLSFISSPSSTANIKSAGSHGNNIVDNIEVASNLSTGVATQTTQSTAAGAVSATVSPNAAIRPTSLQFEELMSSLGAGFDFGVATIWVCPNSCDPAGSGGDGANANTDHVFPACARKRYAVEIAVIQAPAQDI
jgi:hypothetical protein